MENINKTSSVSPRDVFLNLLIVAMVYGTIISFIVLTHQYINFLIPDNIDYYYYSNTLNSIILSMSSLIVLFPIFIFLSWLINKDFLINPRKRKFGLRKWLIYLTLFLASITIIIDLIVLIYNFLNGELTNRFLFKILIVLIVTITVFGYYTWELRKKSNTPSKNKLFSSLAGILILAVIVSGFLLIGTPSHQRDLRMDERRVNDLMMLQNEVLYYFERNGNLPQNIDMLQITAPVDPDTGKYYEYIIVDEHSFRLCAHFATDNQAKTPFVNQQVRYYDPYMQDWSHTSGQYCFERKADSAYFK